MESNTQYVENIFMNKYQALHRLKDIMELDNNLPLKADDTKLVFGAGNTEANILIC